MQPTTTTSFRSSELRDAQTAFQKKDIYFYISYLDFRYASYKWYHILINSHSWVLAPPKPWPWGSIWAFARWSKIFKKWQTIQWHEPWQLQHISGYRRRIRCCNSSGEKWSCSCGPEIHGFDGCPKLPLLKGRFQRNFAVVHGIRAWPIPIVWIPNWSHSETAFSMKKEIRCLACSLLQLAHITQHIDTNPGRSITWSRERACFSLVMMVGNQLKHWQRWIRWRPNLCRFYPVVQDPSGCIVHTSHTGCSSWIDPHWSCGVGLGIFQGTTISAIWRRTSSSAAKHTLRACDFDILTLVTLVISTSWLFLIASWGCLAFNWKEQSSATDETPRKKMADQTPAVGDPQPKLVGWSFWPGPRDCKAFQATSSS